MELDLKKVKQQLGDTVTGELVLKEASVRQTKRGTDFLSAVFTDGTEEISANLWTWTEQKAPDTSKVYSIAAVVSEYLGTRQLSLNTLVLSDNQDLSRFTPQGDISPDGLIEDFEFALGSIGDTELRAIVEKIYDLYMPRLLRASSAKSMHHVGIGGNMTHTLEVVRIALTLAYNVPVGTCNTDLVVAGALLHDIGKGWEYEMNGPVVEVTIEGFMFSHIAIGYSMLEALKNNSQFSGVSANAKINLLQHIILSHHGALEYGSPVLPCILEAYIVHMADKFSADTNVVLNMFKKAGGAKQTDRIYSMGNVPYLLPDYINDCLEGKE